MESDQCLHCLLTKFSIKNENTRKHPFHGNGQAQLIIVGHSPADFGRILGGPGT